MKRQIKRILSILFLVLFVATLIVSSVSAASVSTPLQAAGIIVHDGYCGNGYHIVFPTNPNDPLHPGPHPDPEPWSIVNGQTANYRTLAH